MTRHLLLATALSVAAAPAMAQAPTPPAPPPTTPPCLVQKNIYDFQLVPGNRSLIVIDLARQRFRLNFIGACYNIQYKFGIRFKTFGVTQLACVRKGDQVLYSDPAGPGFCVIRDIQYQTPEMDQQDAAAGAKVKKP
jgi:hypothetical protein